MFTGIIEAVKKIKKKDFSFDGGKITVEIPQDWKLSTGESVSVNGVCLTTISSEKQFAVFDLSGETLKKTNFRDLKEGDFVNLERAMKADGRFSGHFVTGHIDGICKLKDINISKTEKTLEFEIFETTLIVEKGSVALNGVSLTAFDVKEKSFKVAVIPHTWENTNLKYLKLGSKVNIEFDILGKYILKKTKTHITTEFLKENGYI